MLHRVVAIRLKLIWCNVIVFICVTYIISQRSVIVIIMSSVCDCTVDKRYILQQNCLNKWIGSALMVTRQCNFQPLHQPWVLKFPPSKFQCTTYLMFISC